LSSRRIYSRIYSFVTLPAGADEPQYDHPIPAETPACENAVAVVNPGFERGLEGWQRKARRGRAKEPESYVADAEPFGAATPGTDGYTPHSGRRMYGWTYHGIKDPTWKEPREDWKQEIIYQRIEVEPGRAYAFTARLLTGERGSGWGRDTRVRIGVDEADEGLLDSIDTFDRAKVTQWFATKHRWLPVTLRFTPRKKHVTIGVHFLQWWALEANHLYVDDVCVQPLESAD
jgi:hypothetical protein